MFFPFRFRYLRVRDLVATGAAQLRRHGPPPGECLFVFRQNCERAAVTGAGWSARIPPVRSLTFGSFYW